MRGQGSAGTWENPPATKSLADMEAWWQCSSFAPLALSNSTSTTPPQDPVNQPMCLCPKTRVQPCYYIDPCISPQPLPLHFNPDDCPVSRQIRCPARLERGPICLQTNIQATSCRWASTLYALYRPDSVTNFNNLRAFPKPAVRQVGRCEPRLN